MELSEAKEVLKECINTIRVAYIPCRGKHKKIGLSTKDKIAIDTVLQALEELQKENEKLKEIDLTTVHIKGVCDEKARWRNKIKEKIEEQTKRIDELLEDMVDKSTGCINVSYLSKKEKEEVIAKRNGLLVQKATLQQVKDELLKGE